eukprot:jgi/Picre1/28677/NNA_004077.t1
MKICLHARSIGYQWRDDGVTSRIRPTLQPHRSRQRPRGVACAIADDITPEERERIEEEKLRVSDEDIYGISREEWVKLDKPARYLGNEFGSIHKPWDQAQVRFALTYPEIYEVGASNLGHIILYGLLNQEEGLLCDRSYFPAADMTALLAKHDKKLFGVESRRPLNDFDVLGFSLSYELGGTNILEMLHLSGIPISWKERQEPKGVPFDPENNGSPPLIFAGGPTATSNPEPFAEFFDLLRLEMGELLVDIGTCLKMCKKDKLDREDTLFRLATEVKGVYVPQFYAPRLGSVYLKRSAISVQRRVCAPDPFQQIGLVPFVDTVHNRLTVEIRRGYQKSLEERKCFLSLPSQRVDRFDDDIANIISNSGKRSGLTFAPEAGTQRMRDVINKGLTNEELLRGVKTAWDKGWRQVKLYFMIGLPGETDDDVMGIYETIKWLQQECRSGKWHLAVNVTISNFSPKPHTPFQWHSVSTSEFLRKQTMLRTAFKSLHQVKANFTPVG